MCRMLMASGRPGDIGGARLRVLLDMFRRASEEDPHLRAITGGEHSSHGDGWGYYLAWRGPRTGGEILYRSPLPVFVDEDGFLGLEMSLRMALESRWMALIVHSRKASRGLPVTLLDVHPFHTLTPRGGSLVLAHNGSVDLGALEARVEGRSDSLSLALELARMGSADEVIGRLEDDEWRSRVARGGLNVAFALTEPGEGGFVVAGFLHDYKLPREGDGEAFERYYAVSGVWGERFFITMSSTIAELYGGGDALPLEKGTLVTQVLPLEGDLEPGLVEGLPVREEVDRVDGRLP